MSDINPSANDDMDDDNVVVHADNIDKEYAAIDPRLNILTQPSTKTSPPVSSEIIYPANSEVTGFNPMLQNNLESLQEKLNKYN